MEAMEFEITFTDSTMLEANGEYNEVVRLMTKDIEFIGGDIPPPSEDWCVKSNISILHGLGFGSVTCDFYQDGKVVITEFKSSTRDLYCIDIRCLSAWAQKFGWQVPEPTSYVIDAWKDFWLMQWETHVINSEWLEKKIGPRIAQTSIEDLDEEGEVIDILNDDGNLDKYR